MTIHTVRDWPGIEYHLNEVSTNELLSILANAENTATQVTRFIHAVNAEMILRDWNSVEGDKQDDLVKQFLQQLSGAH